MEAPKYTDSGEVDLDALLEDLCVMEKDLNANKTENVNDPTPAMEPTFPVKLNSPISPTAKISADVRSRLESVQEESKELTPEEQQERIKAEKIRIALEKLRAARVKKLVVKVYNDEDPTSKTIAIDQTWTSWEVCKKMMRKNDAEPDPNWVLVERLPELCIERSLEDHESVVDVVSSWPWENNNRIVINNKREKYALFKNPQNYLLSSDTSAGAAQLAEKSKDILLQEYFNESAMRLPELDGVLYLKDGKKSWKKHYFALRASGIYYTPKGKTKSSRDLVCLIKFEFVNIYYGNASFKKKFKAPTDYCFILKHPEYHEVESKAIKYFCAEDVKTFNRWVVCIKLAKYGYQLLENYSETQDEMENLAFTLDKNRFPKAASFSVSARSDENDESQQQLSTARDNAKAQSDRIKKGGFGTGSQSFSVTSYQQQKRKPKTIGNLFSDAWKKGTEYEENEAPISPDTPSTSSAGPGMTPNTTEPRSFNIDNAIIMDDIVEEPMTRPRDLPIYGYSNGEAGIPSPSEVKTKSPPAPPLPPKVTPKPPAPPQFAPVPPPPCAPIPPMPCSAPLPPAPAPFSAAPHLPPAPNISAEPPPPPPVARKPSRSNSTSSQRSLELQSPSREEGPSLITAEPPPPPPVARKPSRSNSTSSQQSIESAPGSPPTGADDFPPPPPPPVMKKPSRSGSLKESRLHPPLPSIHGSTDSLDSLPLPPPPPELLGSDADLPPPPPEVLFKSNLESSLARSNSESRGRSLSGDRFPPPPPPKSGKTRTNSVGKAPPPPPLRT
ncbi:amyloid beta A4 precursor protein-binding family B member 1-interacting protein isoform X2 [Nematostella vectensis]|uniref:amyloid beta A4 precursor protein-binding family B member 1-interacting protein isoform X2 n=1 Tax=Nematostella vectensis TaxID=45351 RepID=UPI002076EB51|nr:amyloid beta A4 precursor protein-binding family B member 1-interacting protein isoform X2 [Nematostella vectensis]